MLRLVLYCIYRNIKGYDEDGFEGCFQRVGIWCEPTTADKVSYHFRAGTLK